ncbi:hypothetical protein QF046_002827 [Microbacterium sp. W4I4]|uniref:hypothetical protein n=1 Tax=Microbacterium sp. W4I4 TaxID=3042295 RepID=UPI002783A426|nr:hypothetical protein [Microbacterium sp. W4I4]MDQ0615186.1 hypothetical protein [Microbacterium sp. W4I4]
MTSVAAERRWAAKITPWTLTVVLLAGAWALNTVALPDGSSEASFATRTTIGEPAATRNLELTVTDVRAARTITDPQGWSAGFEKTQGTWLVVDLDAASVQSQYAASLSFAELTIGDRTFGATERGETFFRQRLVTGVPRSGSLAFELPDDVIEGEALKGTATLRLGVPSDVRYDGIIETLITLEDLPVEESIILAETGWTHG